MSPSVLELGARIRTQVCRARNIIPFLEGRFRVPSYLPDALRMLEGFGHECEAGIPVPLYALVQVERSLASLTAALDTLQRRATGFGWRAPDPSPSRRSSGNC